MINYCVRELEGDRFVVWIDGHADSAPPGDDLVCAAASALAVALTEAVRRLDDEGRAEMTSICGDDGHLQIDFTVAEGEQERALGIINTVTDAFLWLENGYPDCVCVV